MSGAEEGQLADVQRAFARICLDAEPRQEDLDQLYSADDRWLLYRRMVRSRLFQMVRNGLPLTEELLGREALDAAVTRYLGDGGPKTRYIREVVQELADHALPGWASDDSLPAHLPHLVRYEALKWEVSSVLWPETKETSDEFDFEGVPVHNPSVRSTTVSYRVDRKDELKNRPLPVPRKLLAYRRPEDSRIFTYLLPVAGLELYEAWQVPDRSFADGVRAVLSARDGDPEPGFVDMMAGLLAQLVEREIILGSRA